MIRFSAHLGFLFTEQGMLDRPQAAATAGFRAVDIPDPAAYPLRELAAQVRRAGVQVVQISTSFGDVDAGEMGLAALPDRTAEFRENCRQVSVCGRELGATFVHAIAGKPHTNFAATEVRSAYLDNLRFASELFAKDGMQLVIEPCNPTLNAGFYLDSLAKALDVIKDVGSNQVKLLYDSFHMAMTGVRPAWGIENILDKIAHIQIGDSPERNEPGSSSVNFDELFEALKNQQYSGWVSCEYIPKTTTEAGLNWPTHFGLSLRSDN